MKAVIFDLDGTLVDSIGVWKRVDDIVLARYGVNADDLYREEIKMLTYMQCIEYIIEKFKIEKTAAELEKEFTAEALHEYGNNIRLKKGVKEFLEKIKQNGIKTAVLTSCRREMCEAVLKNNGIENYFDAVIYCEELGVNKSSEEAYIFTAKYINEEPSTCVVFEDLAKACESARKAGMTVIGIDDEENMGERQLLEKVCDDIIEDFSDFYEIFVKYM